MKSLSKKEMMNINAGAKYELTCPNGCGYVVGTTYWGWSLISRLVAEAVVGGKMHNHVIDCTAEMAGI